MNGTAKITGGIIKGPIRGVHVKGTGEVTIGREGGEVSTSSPKIIGTGTESNGVGIWVEAGTLNFYDGIIYAKDQASTIVGDIAEVEEHYKVVNGTGTYDGTSYATAYLSNIYTATFNLLYGLEDCEEEDSMAQSGFQDSRMKYSISSGIVTVTAKRDDGYGLTSGRVNLEANKTYKFSCTSNGVLGSESGTDTVQVVLAKDGKFEKYYQMHSFENFEFTPDTTGTYWLRLDVNQNGATHTFSNITISKTEDTKKLTYNTALGTLPTLTREGYTFAGWYTAITGGDKITETTIMPDKDTTYYAHWKEE